MKDSLASIDSLRSPWVYMQIHFLHGLFYFFFMCGSVHVSAGTCGDQKRAHHPMEQELQELHTPVLRAEVSLTC